jgi:hypothetical protein
VKPATLDLPPEIGRAFVRDMRRYFAERNGHKRDEIAARQLYVLGAYLPQHTKFGLTT